MEFQNIGYYIIEPVLKPDCGSLPCKKLLSVSPCFCNIHPILSGCFWQGHKSEKAKHQKRLDLSDSEYKSMSDKVAELFEKKRIDVDSRFISLSDVAQFYQNYLKNNLDIRIIGVSISSKYLTLLTKSAYRGQNTPISAEKITGKLIGGEILGFDGGSFHSYLCNGLDKDIKSKYNLTCNGDTGLIQNNYEQIEIFAESIAGLGEPVDWLPFLLYDCTDL